MNHTTLHRDIENGASRLQTPFLLGIRLLWGSQFALAGFGKLTDLESATRAFAGWGFPAPGAHAAFSGVVELCGGLLLLLGLFSRPAALLLSVIMLGALGSAHRAEVLSASLTDAGPALTALPTTYLLTVLVVLFFGPGEASLDARLFGTSREVIS